MKTPRITVPNQDGKTIPSQNRTETEIHVSNPDGNRTETGRPSTLSLSLKTGGTAFKKTFGRWASNIESDDFDELENAVPHFQRAVDAGLLRERFDRVRFFTLWLYCSRAASDGRAENPASTLIDNLKKDNWRGKNEDEDEARQFLREWDRKHHGGFSDAAHAVADALCDDTELPEDFDDE